MPGVEVHYPSSRLGHSCDWNDSSLCLPGTSQHDQLAIEIKFMERIGNDVHSGVLNFGHIYRLLTNVSHLSGDGTILLP